LSHGGSGKLDLVGNILVRLAGAKDMDKKTCQDTSKIFLVGVSEHLKPSLELDTAVDGKALTREIRGVARDGALVHAGVRDLAVGSLILAALAILLGGVEIEVDKDLGDFIDVEGAVVVTVAGLAQGLDHGYCTSGRR